jgi:hypothetical protein
MKLRLRQRIPLTIVAILSFLKLHGQVLEVRDGPTFNAPSRITPIEASIISDAPESTVDFQILRIAGKPADEISAATLNLAKLYRTDNQIVFLKVGPNTWLKVFPTCLAGTIDLHLQPAELFVEESFVLNQTLQE